MSSYSDRLISKSRQELDNAYKATKNAEQWLNQVIEHGTRNDDAYYLLAWCMETPEQKRLYLEKALSINPEHDQAQKFLEQVVRYQRDQFARQSLFERRGQLADQLIVASQDKGRGHRHRPVEAVSPSQFDLAHQCRYGVSGKLALRPALILRVKLAEISRAYKMSSIRRGSIPSSSGDICSMALATTGSLPLSVPSPQQ